MRKFMTSLYVLSSDKVSYISSMIPQDRVTAHRALRDILANGTPARFDCRYSSGRCAYAEVLPLSSGALCRFLSYSRCDHCPHGYVTPFYLMAVGTLTDQTEQRLFVQQQLEAERLRAETAEKQRYLQESFVDIGMRSLVQPHLHVQERLTHWCTFVSLA